jgi:hypothetical protein
MQLPIPQAKLWGIKFGDFGGQALGPHLPVHCPDQVTWPPRWPNLMSYDFSCTVMPEWSVRRHWAGLQLDELSGSL